MDGSQSVKVSSDTLPISIVVPTYGRDDILIATIKHLLELEPKPAEILVIDQTEKHKDVVENTLNNWELSGAVKLIHLPEPSIPRAMNCGLCEAKQNFVLFVDDDIIPDPGLLEHHLRALERSGAALVAGRVLQPWQEEGNFSDDDHFHFASTKSGWMCEFMGGNFTVRRDVALRLGGFDEQFVRVAYNFEAEFSFKLNRAGYRIFFEPAACVHHLKASEGGTRTFGDHLKSYRPHHAVGEYYFILRTWSGWQSVSRFLRRPLRAIATQHHIRRPWWIPVTLVAEFSGMVWAILLALRGPRYLSSKTFSKVK